MGKQNYKEWDNPMVSSSPSVVVKGPNWKTSAQRLSLYLTLFLFLTVFCTRLWSRHFKTRLQFRLLHFCIDMNCWLLYSIQMSNNSSCSIHNTTYFVAIFETQEYKCVLFLLLLSVFAQTIDFTSSNCLNIWTIAFSSFNRFSP